MLSRLTLNYRLEKASLSPWDRQLKLSMGSIFHALFLEDMALRVPTLFEFLHTRQNHLRPYKLSWPRYRKDEINEDSLIFSWHINALTEELADYLQRWSEEPTLKIALNQLDNQLVYQSHQFEEGLSFTEFSKQFYNPAFTPPEKLNLMFESPTTFNWSLNGDYIPLPDPKLILTSLYTKWNTFSEKLSLEDDEILNHFMTSLRIKYVQVQNMSAMVSRHAIPCFRGELGLSFSRKTPQSLRQLLVMLLYFAQYAGVGAKTAMGLGDCTLSFSSETHPLPKRLITIER